MMNDQTDKLHLDISAEELTIIRLCMNEVANGVPFSDDEIHTRLGCERREIIDLLAKFRPLKDHKGAAEIQVLAPVAGSSRS